MAQIKALRGIHYHTAHFAPLLPHLVAPPYDVISPEEQDALYARHAHNIVRIDLNRAQPQDTPDHNPYTRARRHLMDWLALGVLEIAPKPALYYHAQTFDDGKGNVVTRKGFIGLTKLAEYDEKIVLPHERTLKGPKIDRLNLMKATECNLSQVFMLYGDRQRQVDKAFERQIDLDLPTFDLTTPDGIRHKLWVVDDEGTLTQVAAALEDAQLLIADGHHRYETALAYRDFRRHTEEDQATDDPRPYDYVMCFFVNMEDPGLLVFPTHRVVHSVPPQAIERMFERIEETPEFEVEDLGRHEPGQEARLLERCEAAGKTQPSFVLIDPKATRVKLVKFVGDETSELFDQETPPQVRALDVAVLHEGILDRMLGISKADQEAKTNLWYLKKFDEAVATLEQPETQLLVLMNATPVAQVDEVCRSGGKMPQKSTYFYPKILSGLVINPL